MRLLLAAFALLLPRPVRADELTLAGAYAAALRFHEDPAAAAAAVAEAEANRATARAGLLPSLSASGGLSTSTGGGSSLSGSLGAEQTLLDPALYPTLRAQGALVLAAEQSEEATRLALLHAVAAAWYGARAADAALAAREEAVDVEEALLVGVEAQAGAGASLPLAVTRQRVALAEARSAAAQASRDRALARLALARLTGLPTASSTLADPGPVPVAPASAGPTPAERAAAAKVRAAEAVLAAERAGRAPDVGAWAETGPTLALSSADPAWDVAAGLSASIPLFSGGALAAGVDAAAADLAAAEADQRAAERDAAEAREEAAARVGAAVARLAAAEAARDAAAENLAGVRALLAAGRATPLEVADAGATLSRAAGEAIAAALERDVARLAAWQAAGQPPPGAPE